MNLLTSIRALCLGGALWASAGFAAADAAPKPVDFNHDVRPLLAERCYACHGPDSATRKADLRFDDEKSAKSSVIKQGKPNESEIIRRVTSTDPKVMMPPPESKKKPLSAEEADLLKRWIAEGAPWAKHWAFEAPKRPAAPAVKNATWQRNDIDAFVLAKLEAAGLQPAHEATRETLIRRLSFDLIGLPPTPEEIDAFLMDNAPNAYEKVVDRLLASQFYGERMALDWLDGARYADTNGYQNDFQRYMWPWRDWVIKAYNDNLPFDRFTIEQIAGDMLPGANESQRVATGFNRNNHSVTEGGAIEEEWRIENLIDRVETTSNVFLGLSMGCARCHDHKYDPISQKEFYKFLAFFNSTEDKGYYNETKGNTGPIVSLPTFENQVKLAAFDTAIADAKTAVKNAEAGIETHFAAWKTEVVKASEPALGGTLKLRLPLHGNLDAAAAPEGFKAAYGAPAGPKFVDGLLGPSLQLDGTLESSVDLGGAIAFERDTKFTVACWAKPDGAGAVFSKMDDNAKNRGIDLIVNPSGEVSVHLVHEWPKDALRVTTNDKIPLGTWSHLAMTYDGSNKAEGIKIFIGGRKAALRVDTSALTNSIATNEPLRIGRRSASQFFKGAVADFQVFERAFTETKILDLVDYAVGQSLAAGATPERDKLLHDFFARRGDQEVVAARQSLEKLEREKNEYTAEKVPSVMVMQESAEPRPAFRLVRGQYDKPDKTEPLSPDVPAFLPALPKDTPKNRLGLARWLVSAENPLTSRVMVNRLWMKFFGQGFVKSTDNLGTQSDAPTHPELLDWLAVEFRERGWDMKALQKEIVMSAAYRQDSSVGETLLARDPENRLLARGPRFRLSAELIRDNALAVSGLLATRIGGPSVKPYQPDGLWAELAGGAGEGPYVLAKGEDLYRRSLYIYRKRTVSHPLVNTFDAPSWEICRVQRGRTNTPLQALALLNDLTYVEAARNLAQRMLSETRDPASAPLQYGFRLATGRKPTPNEMATLQSGLDGYLNTFKAAPAEAEALLKNGDSPADPKLDRIQLAAYTAVAGVMLNLDETISKE